MRKILAALALAHVWQRLFDTPVPADPADSLSPREWADLPAHHPAAERV